MSFLQAAARHNKSAVPKIISFFILLSFVTGSAATEKQRKGTKYFVIKKLILHFNYGCFYKLRAYKLVYYAPGRLFNLLPDPCRRCLAAVLCRIARQASRSRRRRPAQQGGSNSRQERPKFRCRSFDHRHRQSRHAPALPSSPDGRYATG